MMKGMNERKWSLEWEGVDVWNCRGRVQTPYHQSQREPVVVVDAGGDSADGVAEGRWVAVVEGRGFVQEYTVG
jgi:hypothetical protein